MGWGVKDLEGCAGEVGPPCELCRDLVLSKRSLHVHDG